MAKRIVVISGMPGSGKDAVTELLCKSSDDFVSLMKYRSIGSDYVHKDKYYNVTSDVFETMIVTGEFLQYHRRYDRYYGIAQNTLQEYFMAGKIPVVHIGRIENYHELMRNIPRFEDKYLNGDKLNVLHVQLWQEENDLKEIVSKRGNNGDDIADRINAIEEEFDDNIALVSDGVMNPYDLVIKNTDPEYSCSRIIEYINSGCVKDEADSYKEFKLYLTKLGESRPKLNKSAEWKSCVISDKISGLVFVHDISIDNARLIQGHVLEIIGCEFKNLYVKNLISSPVNSRIEKIIFRKCKAESVNLFNCRNIVIKFEDCKELKNIEIDGASDSLSISLKSSFIPNVVIKKSAIVKDLELSLDSVVKLIDCRGESLQDITINDSCLEFLIVKGSISNVRLQNAAYLKRFLIDKFEILNSYLEKLRTDRISYENTSELRSLLLNQKMLLQALLSNYEKEHRFSEADKCLIELRIVDNLDKKMQGHKFIANISSVVLGTLCGWGVRSRNIIFTTLGIILLFSIFYIVSLTVTNGAFLWHIVPQCLSLSFCAFFNLDASEDLEALRGLVVAEEALGIIILTVFTGIIVRKIIR